MAYTTIHTSGQGGQALRVDSWHNGGAYAVHLGEGGAPSRTLWFQDDDATALRAEYDQREEAAPETSCRRHWLATIDPHLD